MRNGTRNKCNGHIIVCVTFHGLLDIVSSDTPATPAVGLASYRQTQTARPPRLVMRAEGTASPVRWTRAGAALPPAWRAAQAATQSAWQRQHAADAAQTAAWRLRSEAAKRLIARERAAPHAAPAEGQAEREPGCQSRSITGESRAQRCKWLRERATSTPAHAASRARRACHTRKPGTHHARRALSTSIPDATGRCLVP